MALNTTIITRPENQNPSQDFEFLREQGIEHLEKLATRLWSDFNSHDPGVTILELLCYAITDLGYRTSLEDLTIFNPAGGAVSGPSKSFYTPGEIFRNSPLTWDDYRRILIDLPEVANAWISKAPAIDISPAFVTSWDQPVFKPDYANSQLLHVTGSETDPVCNDLNGLYRVVIEFERDLLVKCGETGAAQATAKQAVVDLAAQLLHQHRGLCEDFTFVGGPDGCEEIKVRAEIDILSDANAADVMAQMVFDMENFLIPPVRFYSIEELQEKGLTTDRIFEGPLLNHGFIWGEELKKLSKRKVIYVSDLIQVIMDVPGVRGVNFIEVDSCTFVYSTLYRVDRTDPWCLVLPSGDVDSANVPLFPNMDFQLYLADIDPDPSAIQPVNFVSGLSPVPLNAREAAAKLEQLRGERKISRLEEKALDIALPAGDEADLEGFYPIQNDLPLTYGTGPEGVVRPATDERLAQARQLKTFLMFFEQIIADYFSQLAHARDLLSWEDLQETYYSQLVQDVADLSNLYDSPLTTNDLRNLVENTTGTEYYQRRNKFLNHLMARFSEQMTEYSLIQYTKREETRLIDDKRRLLEDYQPVSSERGKAFNYKLNIDYTDVAFSGTDNISGYQKRVCRLVGIENWQERPLDTGSTGYDAEGMHVVEHIFVRPVNDNSDFLEVAIGPTEELSCLYDKDPYSFRMTVILPAWPDRFQDYHYRKYIERIIRQEAPAHVAVDPKWLSEADMLAFESCWFPYLTEHGQPIPDTTALNTHLNCVIDALNNCEDHFDARYSDPLEKNEDYFRTEGEKITSVIDPVGNPVLAQTAIPPVAILGTPISSGWGFPTGIKLVKNATELEDGTLLSTIPGSFAPGDIIVTDPWVLDTGNEVWTPGGINLPNEAPHGIWQWTINVTNDKGDFSQHRVVIKILNDNESVFTPVTKNIDAYVDGEELGNFTDTDGNIVNAYLYPVSGGPAKPAWLGFNPTTGQFTVISASQMRTNLPTIATISGNFYTLQFTVITIDDQDGVTKSIAELKIRMDIEAVYNVLRCGYNNSYPNEDSLTDGSLLAWVTDGDVPGDPAGITAAVQTGGPPLPTWLTLHSNGDIVVNDSLYTATSGARYVDPIDLTITVQTTDTYGGQSTISNVRIKIVADTKATYNQVEDRILCLCPGDVVVSFHDADAPIHSWSFSPGNSLPAGLEFHPNGNIIVSSASSGGSSYYQPPYYNYQPNLSSKISTGMEGVALKPWEQQRGMYPPYINNNYPVCTTNLIPGVYNVQVRLVDKCGGISDMNFNITIRGDRPASRNVPKIKPVHCYKNGVTVVSFSDPDASIVYAVAPTLPAGLQINSTSGKITVGNETTFQAALNSNKVQSFVVHTMDACGGETYHSFTINFNLATTGGGTGVYTTGTMKAANQYVPGEKVAGPSTSKGVSSAWVAKGALPDNMTMDSKTGNIYFAKSKSGGSLGKVAGGTENRALTGGESKITVAIKDDCGTISQQQVVIGILDETPEATVEYIQAGVGRLGQLEENFSDVLVDNF